MAPTFLRELAEQAVRIIVHAALILTTFSVEQTSSFGGWVLPDKAPEIQVWDPVAFGTSEDPHLMVCRLLSDL